MNSSTLTMPIIHRAGTGTTEWLNLAIRGDRGIESDTYGIEISPGQDEPLILAVSVCLDRMSRD
jgi:hypothetical protein